MRYWIIAHVNHIHCPIIVGYSRGDAKILHNVLRRELERVLFPVGDFVMMTLNGRVADLPFPCYSLEKDGLKYYDATDGGFMMDVIDFTGVNSNNE